MVILDDNPVVFSNGLLGDAKEVREGRGRMGDMLRLLVTGLGTGLGGLGMGGPGTWISLQQKKEKVYQWNISVLHYYFLNQQQLLL